jgi:hypothetical protein
MALVLVALPTAGAQSAPSTTPWWKHALIDEIYPRSFQDSNGDGIGDLNGIASHFDYLEKLGVDAIWIAPMYPSPQVDFGYDISNYEAVDPQYGTMADMDRLIAKGKEHHIRIILDMVLNHTSDKHAWFVESSSSRTNPKQDWYVWVDGISAEAPGVTVFRPTTGSPCSAAPLGSGSLRDISSITTSSISNNPTSTGATPPSRRHASTPCASGSTRAWPASALMPSRLSLRMSSCAMSPN